MWSEPVLLVGYVMQLSELPTIFMITIGCYNNMLCC